MDINDICDHDLVQALNDESKFRTLYSKIDKDIHRIKHFLESEVDEFTRTTGTHRLAFSSARVKTSESFIHKVQKRAESLAESSQQKQNQRNLFDLVTDLIGIRMVFYFEQDIDDALIFWSTSPLFKIRQVRIWSHPAHRNESEVFLLDLFRNLNSENVIDALPKGSGYESIHLIVSLNPSLLRISQSGDRQELASIQDDSKLVGAIDEVLLESLTFEVQLRTLLEHNWAEVEHRLNYARRKSGEEDFGELEEMNKTFRNLHLVHRATQNFQNSLRPKIRTGYRIPADEAADGGHLLFGRSTSIELGERLNPLQQEFRSMIEQLRSEYTEAIKTNHWDQILPRFNEILQALGDRSQLKLSEPNELTAADWAQRKPLFLLLNFIMAYAGEHTIRIKAAEFAPVIFGDDFLLPPEMVAIRCYQTMQILDHYFAGDQNYSNLFYDPLPYVRSASVYFRHFGSFRRSTRLLKQALQMVQVGSVNKNVLCTGFVMSRPYICRRIAENFWTAYHLEGRRESDLNSAIEYIKLAWDYRLELPTGENIRASQKIVEKILAQLVTIQAYKTGLNKDAIKSREASFPLWTALEAYQKEIEEYLQPYGPQLATSEGNGLRRQAYSIWMAAQLPMISQVGTTTIGHHLAETRRVARRAVQAIKTKTHNSDNPVPYHYVLIAQEIEGFISHLFSDDYDIAGQSDRISTTS